MFVKTRLAPPEKRARNSKEVHMDSEQKPTTLRKVGRAAALPIQAAIVGICAGLVVGAFRLVHETTGARITQWLHEGREYWWTAPLWTLCAIVLACVTGLMLRRWPLIGGSGIPHVEAALAGRISMRWKRILAPKFAGSMLALWGGLSLGREGPCIQMGAAVGRALGLCWGEVALPGNRAVIGGAAAGLAAAFGAPLAGVLFVFEEMKCRLSLSLAVMVGLASFAAWVALRLIFGMGQILPFNAFAAPDLRDPRQLLLVAVFGVIMGVMGALYNVMLIAMKHRYDRQRLTPAWLKPLWPFLAGVGLAFTLPAVLGGGDSLIIALSDTPFSLRMLIILMLVKLAFSLFSFSCGAPGGLLMPVLCIGALMGAVFGHAAVTLDLLAPSEINAFLVFGMAACFAGAVRAPLTGIALCVEMSGATACLPGLLLAGLLAAVTADLLRSEPVYITLRKDLLRNPPPGA